MQVYCSSASSASWLNHLSIFSEMRSVLFNASGYLYIWGLLAYRRVLDIVDELLTWDWRCYDWVVQLQRLKLFYLNSFLWTSCSALLSEMRSVLFNAFGYSYIWGLLAYNGTIRYSGWEALVSACNGVVQGGRGQFQVQLTESLLEFKIKTFQK